VDEQTLSITDQHVAQIKQMAGPQPSKTLHALERQYGVKRLKPTDIDEVRWRFFLASDRGMLRWVVTHTQVWFAGCHCGPYPFLSVASDARF